MSIPELDDAFRMAEEIYGRNGSKPNGGAMLHGSMSSAWPT